VTPEAERLLSAAEHCAAAEHEFALARQLSPAESDEYRRRMEHASMHLRIAEVMTQASALVTEYAVAERDPRWRQLGIASAREVKAWNTFLGKHGSAR
jgi:hypothetical protein